MCSAHKQVLVLFTGFGVCAILLYSWCALVTLCVVPGTTWEQRRRTLMPTVQQRVEQGSSRRRVPRVSVCPDWVVAASLLACWRLPG